MPEWTIPKGYRPGIISIATAEDDVIEALVGALGSVAPSRRTADLVAHIAPAVARLTEEELVGVIDALISLYYVRDGLSVSLDTLVEGLGEGIQQVPELSNLSETERERFGKRMIRLLEFRDSLGLASKALALSSEFSHTYHSARILTDVRPVFDQEADAEPKGAIITQTIKLEYHEGGEIKELYVTLDSRQMGQLTEMIERAGRKSEFLKSILGRAGIGYIDR